MRRRYVFIAEKFFGEFKHMFKTGYVLILVAVIPLIYPLLMSLTYMNEQVYERNIVVLDTDNSRYSRDFVFNLDATQEVTVLHGDVDSIEEGIHAVMLRQADAFVFIPSDFSDKIKRGKAATLKVYAYTANMLVYAATVKGLNTAATAVNDALGLKRLWYMRGKKSQLTSPVAEPVKLQMQKLYAPRTTYSSFLVPGILFVVFQQAMWITMAFSMGFRREYETKMIYKHGAKNVKRVKYRYRDYLAFFLAHLCILTVGMLFNYLVLFPYFGWPVGNVNHMILLMTIFLVAQFPIGAIFADFCKDRYGSFQLMLWFSVPTVMISGYVWPTSSMPSLVSAVTGFFGITPALSAMRMISFKEAALDEIFPHFIHLALLFLLYSAILIIVTRRDYLKRNIAMLIGLRKYPVPKSRFQ